VDITDVPWVQLLLAGVTHSLLIIDFIEFIYGPTSRLFESGISRLKALQNKPRINQNPLVNRQVPAQEICLYFLEAIADMATAAYKEHRQVS